MRWFRTAGSLLIVAGIFVAAAWPQGPPRKPRAPAYPKDIFPDSGNRLPPVKSQDLDDAGKKYYEALVAQNVSRGRPAEIAPGPQAIRMYSPPVAEAMNRVNQYLRNQAGIEPRLGELAILVAARAMDNQYEWTDHEPTALKAGLSQQVIDIVKHRKPVPAIEEKEAAVIQLGREALEKHKVASDTFARALKLFGKQGVVNIVSLMCHYSATATLLTAFDQQLSPDEKPLLPLR